MSSNQTNDTITGKVWVTYIGAVEGDEAAFYRALRDEGMEEGSYAIAAAMRGFRRFNQQETKGPR